MPPKKIPAMRKTTPPKGRTRIPDADFAAPKRKMPVKKK